MKTLIKLRKIATRAYSLLLIILNNFNKNDVIIIEQLFKNHLLISEKNKIDNNVYNCFVCQRINYVIYFQQVQVLHTLKHQLNEKKLLFL